MAESKEVDRGAVKKTYTAKTNAKKTRTADTSAASTTATTTTTPDAASTTSTSSGGGTTTTTNDWLQRPEYDYGEYTESDYLKAMREAYAGYNGYTAKTDEEIQAQAEGETKSYYDRLRLAAQQSYEKSDLALQQQAEGLQSTYDKMRDSSREEYANAYSQADRQLLSRGMQRSSYGAQTLSNVNLKAAKAQQDISDQQAQAESNIYAQRTQLADQIGQTLQQYAADQANDVLSRIRALQDTEYERNLTDQQYRTNLANSIYSSGMAEYNNWMSNQQWQKQFDESKYQYDAQHQPTTTTTTTGGTKTTTDTTGNTGNTGNTGTYGDMYSFLNAMYGNNPTGTNNSGGLVIAGSNGSKSSKLTIAGSAGNKSKTTIAGKK